MGTACRTTASEAIDAISTIEISKCCQSLIPIGVDCTYVNKKLYSLPLIAIKLKNFKKKPI